MRQTMTNRSRQLLYIALAASIFSILSMSYKYATAKDRDPKIAKSNCQVVHEEANTDDLCLEFDSKVQFSSINP